MSLVFENVGVRYGGVDALRAVSLSIERGHVLGLIGPNGAGKTTLVNATTGLAPLASGRSRSTRCGSTGCRRTASRAPASPAPTRISGCSGRSTSARTSLPARTRVPRVRVMPSSGRCWNAPGPRTLDLAARAGSLPYGDQRRLEIARALAGAPVVLMLDEPAAGMNPSETTRLVETIRAIAAGGIAVLLIEHDMTLVRAACDSVVVLNFGEVIARGTPAQVARDPVVVEAYLGSGAEALA